MCIGVGKTPDVPKIPERQATKLPDNGSTAANADLAAKRRRGLYASIMTSAQGAAGAPTTTAKTTLG
jgi:hypothetical protein